MICRFNADLPDDQVSSESDGKLRSSKMITCQVSCQREKLKVITIVVSLSRRCHRSPLHCIIPKSNEQLWTYPRRAQRGDSLSRSSILKCQWIDRWKIAYCCGGAEGLLGFQEDLAQICPNLPI